MTQLRARPKITLHFGHRILGSSLNALRSRKPQHIDGYASAFVLSDRPNLPPICAPKCEVIFGRALSFYRERHFGCKIILTAFLLLPLSCKSRSDLKRDQEMERLKQELNTVRGEKADVSYITDELKQDFLKLGNMVEENAQLAQRRFEEANKREEELRKELAAVSGRIEMLENKDLDMAQTKTEPEKKPVRFESGKKLFDARKYAEALEIFKAVAQNRSRGEEAKRAQFMAAECYFEQKDYASAALEYSEFKKSFPKDSQVPSAIYRQANAFRLMGRGKEAKLFYQELLGKFPKHVLSTKAREEMKRLK